MQFLDTIAIRYHGPLLQAIPVDTAILISCEVSLTRDGDVDTTALRTGVYQQLSHTCRQRTTNVNAAHPYANVDLTSP